MTERRWIAGFRRWRDRLLSDPDFQRRSLRWAITRPIARRRMRALFDLCSGFVYSQTLLACTRLGVINALAESPRRATDLAESLDLPRDSLETLLEAAVSLRLVEKRGPQRFGLGPLGAALRGNPAVAMMIEHHAGFYADLADPVALLRGEVEATRLGRFWPYADRPEPKRLRAAETSPYTELMAASQEMIAAQVLNAYPVRRHRSLLDVGGGSGAFAIAALARAPRLRAEIFDLPAVAEQAGARLREHGYDERARATGGDFAADDLPGGHDLITLVRVLHDQDDDQALTILRAARRALAPGGVVLIAEPMLGTRGAEPVTAAYFGFYLMAMGQGRPRSPERIQSMLESAGFTAFRRYRTDAPLLARIITARVKEA
ncbi:MAG: methyltransferase [Wenzhouxiangellaceae bacterium]